MNDDTISRQAVLNTAEWVCKACEGNFLYYHDLLVAAIMDMAPEQRWIPCSERLPKAYESVNVTVRIPEGRYVKESAFLNGVWIGVSAPAKVVAWQPLPKPYKDGDHETD